MLRLGLLLGLAAGAIATLLMAKPESVSEDGQEPIEGTDLRSRATQMKRQVQVQLQQARQAAQDEAAAKEAEMRRDFEESLHPKRDN